ncbi:hypothetical protein IEO21_09884 [Rhodonia placenta]|uniref:F-box domain-containing protein n=1 Tax=Rhodonia placenta TaxID=104341 RepID=A0A8H7NTF5_9APHY|nr:hypothetical protein IEO21_09884 [Postia placenta]
MVRPFPNEIWLDIFHGLAKEGEYDALERCRVVCREFEPMAEECLTWYMAFKNVEEVGRIKVGISGGRLRRWSGPERVYIEGGNLYDGRRPIPHLATFASKFVGRWPRVKKLWIEYAMWRAQDLDLDAVVRDLAAFAITHLCLRVVTFPSILTLGRLLCALPRLKTLTLYGVQFTQHPLDVGAISRFHLLPHTQLETLYLDHGHDDTELRPSFVELVDLMAAVSNRRCLVPPPSFAQASPWNTVRRLVLGRITFPSVTTFARLLCALPSLEALRSYDSFAFVKHGFDLRSLPVHPGLPLHLADVALGHNYPLHSDPYSVADLFDLFIATGLSENLQRIGLCLSLSPRVTRACDAALSKLVKHSQSLQHLSFQSYPRSSVSNTVESHADQNAAPYFDVSSNACLERLDLTVGVDHEDISHLCAPAVEVLSQVTSAHISHIEVDFWPRYDPGARLNVDLGKLMVGLPQLDVVLSRPIFNNLADVIVDIRTLDRGNVRDAESAHDLRLCLPTLNARGILGLKLNDVDLSRSGLHWDRETKEWRCHKIERISAQDAVVTHTGADADDNRRTNNTTTITIPHDDSDLVPATSQPVWVPPAVYADAKTPFLGISTDARVPADSACDDEFVLPNATASLGPSVDKFAFDDQGPPILSPNPSRTGTRHVSSAARTASTATIVLSLSNLLRVRDIDSSAWWYLQDM